MTLQIARGLSIPDDYVTQTGAILARRGAGKTHTGVVLTEELISAKQPVVVLDPTGVWWGLRSSRSGADTGLPVTILGGEHGDVPLEPTAGRLVADLVSIEAPGFYVLDMSSFDTNRAQDRFAEDFATRLYRAKATQRTPLHLMIDEADSFVPQRPGKSQLAMLGAFEALVRRGRSRGIGMTMISQRPAVINKNVLTQIEVLIALQVTAPQDRAALEDWAKGYGDPEQRKRFLDGLASLQVGEAWIWSPQWLEIFTKHKIRQRITYDSSSTPKGARKTDKEIRLAKVDLDVLRTRMAETIEKAEQNDPVKLRREIARLEGELAQRNAAPEVEYVTETVEVPVFDPELLDDLRRLKKTVDEIQEVLGEADFLSIIHNLLMITEQVANPPLVVQGVLQAQPKRQGGVAAVVGDVKTPRGFRDVDSGDDEQRRRFGKAERKVLSILCQFPEGRTVDQLCILSGYSKKSSTMSVVLSNLRRLGYVTREGLPRATDLGLAEMDGKYETLPTGPDLLEHWRRSLDGTSLNVLDAMLAGADSFDEVARVTGYSSGSSTISVAMSKLRRLGLVSKQGYRIDEDFAVAIR